MKSKEEIYNNLLHVEYSESLTAGAEKFILKCFEEKAMAIETQPELLVIAINIIQGIGYCQPNMKAVKIINKPIMAKYTRGE